MNKPFGRAWALKKVNGKRGAICEFSTGPDKRAIKLHINKLLRLKQWCKYFGVVNRIDKIVKYIQSGPHTEKIIIP